MGFLALLLSALGSILLFTVADLRWGFAPLPLTGLEAGSIVASLALFAGLAVSTAATGFAFLQIRRATNSTRSRWLLAWCSALLLGFGLMFVV